MTEYISNIHKILKFLIKKKKVPLHEPFFDKKEISLLSSCIKSGYVSSVGKSIGIFEKKISKLTKSKYCIATVNGTSAIHIGLLALGLKKNEEILMPSLGFVAAPNAVSYCGGVPNFVDSEKKTLGIDPKKLDNYLKKISVKNYNNLVNKQTGRIIKGVISIHLYGYASDVEGINNVCKKYNIFHLEDAF